MYVESYLRRDHREKDWGRFWPVAVLVLLFAIAFFVDKTGLVGGIFAEKAHAEDTIQAKDVHTEYGACQYLKQHPGSITNASSLNCHG